VADVQDDEPLLGDSPKDNYDDCEPAWLTGALLVDLLANKAVARPAECHSEQLEQLGLCADGRQIWLPSDVTVLNLVRFNELLDSRAQRLWPRVVMLPAIASTNTRLLDAGEGAVGQLLTTEYQFGGRGRLGRRWFSPVGRNLCVSVGLKVSGSADRLAGLSLVVGLAVADALISAGVPEVKLKWPNDLIVMSGDDSYAKLGGILVDVQIHPDFFLAVIGIGLNQGGARSSRTAVDVPIADIEELRPGLGRTEVLARVINSLADYMENFLELGFAPMKTAWETLHGFADREVTLSATGDGKANETQVGRALGVSDSGRLIVRIGDQLVEFDVGDVSLRPLVGAP